MWPLFLLTRYYHLMLPEIRIRLDAIAYALSLREKWVAVPEAELARFPSGGQWIFLRGAQGVFKPKELSEPISIRSTLASPYMDEVIGGSQILYDFAPAGRDYENDGLKQCAERELPLVYLLQLKGKPKPEYEVFAPVYIAGWSDSDRQFLVDLSGHRPEIVERHSEALFQIAQLDKQYVVTQVERRLHQAKFRNQILQVYRERCAVCVLRLRPLLDAAHIIPDRDAKNTLNVNEGLSLCATHHRAFDARILRYDSEYRVRVELPTGFAAGSGEQSMLLLFDGKPLTLPADEQYWPVAGS
ncbi:MAG: HNH endonuclease [Acidobacteriota bacterium]